MESEGADESDGEMVGDAVEVEPATIPKGISFSRAIDEQLAAFQYEIPDFRQIYKRSDLLRDLQVLMLLKEPLRIICDRAFDSVDFD